MAEVNNSLQVAYNIRNFVDQSNIVDYSIYEAVTRGLTVAYSIKLTVFNQLKVKYNIPGLIRRDLLVTYNIDDPANFLFNSLIVSYDILEGSLESCKKPTLMSPNRIYKVSRRTCQY